MVKKRIVIDTNNLISSLGWEGKSRELMNKVIDMEYDLFISGKQLIEIKRVMNYPKFGFTEQQKSEFLKILLQIANLIDTKTEINVSQDKADNMIIGCAVEANADYIISGDTDLTKLGRYNKIRILNVNDFLNENTE